MDDSLAAVVLAAGAGTRLRPLTLVRPKALCPVNNVPLVDGAIERVRQATTAVAVNVHHGRAALESHLADRGDVVVSLEDRRPLGTAGALGHLRDWIEGRPTLVTNADAWLDDDGNGNGGDVPRLLDGWDRERIRLLVVADDRRPDFDGRWRYAGVAAMPWSEVAPLPADEPAGLYELSWRRALEEHRVDLVPTDTPFRDCGTAADYLAANLAASGGESVVGDRAVVGGELVRSVVWPDAQVGPHERLVDAIRADDRITVLVR